MLSAALVGVVGYHAGVEDPSPIPGIFSGEQGVLFMMMGFFMLACVITCFEMRYDPRSFWS